MSAEFVFNCLLVVTMIWLASNAPELERRQTMFVAALLAADWMLFNLAWVRPVAPAHLLKLIGLPVEHRDVWMVTDALVGAMILAAAAEYRWAILLWGLLFCQVVATGVASEPPQRILDALFYSQIVVFFFFRGGGIASFWHSVRRPFLRAGAVSQARTEGRAR